MTRSSSIARVSKDLEKLVSDRLTHYVLFIDLCGSTNYKQQLVETRRSDSIWLVRQLHFLQLASTHITEHEGQVVKSMGDGILAMFDFSVPAKDILLSNVNLIKAYRNSVLYRDADLIKIRVSLDYGDTINGAIVGKAYDPLGTCVDRCSRLNKEARPNQIVISDAFRRRIGTRNIAGLDPAILTFLEDKGNLKGIGQSIFYRVKLKM